MPTGADALPVQTILLLIAIAVLANVALIAVSPGPVGDRVRALLRRSTGTSRGVPVLGGDTAAAADGEAGPGTGLRPAALGRVIRVGTWIFLFAATTIVAVTDLWGDRQAPIIGVLVAAGIFNLVLNEVLRGRVQDSLLLSVEGVGGLVFAAALIALTGGVTSPFFFAFPLIVVGAATVVAPGITLVLTAAAGAAYLAGVIVAGPPSPTPAGLATIGVNLTAIGLTAYVAMAVGREHRRVREEAFLHATVDQLTGLRTRAYLFSALERELARSERTGRRFCLLMIDLDELKTINDRHGHLAGDRALRVVGDVIHDGIRRIDTGARFGGDEFVVLLPETDPTGGWVLAEKIRQGVAAAGVVTGQQAIATSVSVGLVSYPDEGASIDELLERADAAMYRSKRSGRDRVTGVPVMGADGAPAGGRGRPV